MSLDNEIILTCPHCLQLCIVLKKEINCAIFRHGVYIKTMKQIDPHANKKICDELALKGLIHGCGKPFRLIKSNIDASGNACADACNFWIAEKCGYI